jgi:F0F1-type ATP synthase assembly protein I
VEWSQSVRIGKPLLIGTTAIGVPIGIYEAFALAGAMGVLVVALIGMFGAGIAWIVAIARAEQRAERQRSSGG